LKNLGKNQPGSRAHDLHAAKAKKKGKRKKERGKTKKKIKGEPEKAQVDL